MRYKLFVFSDHHKPIQVCDLQVMSAEELPEIEGWHEVLIEGTLTELMTFVRERWDQDGIDRLLQEVVEIQNDQNPERFLAD